MTSRERVICSLNHEQPDRIPIYFGAMISTGINAIAYNKLKDYLNETEGTHLSYETTYIYDICQQLAIPEQWALDRFHADVLQLCRNTPNFGINIESYKPGECTDGSFAMVPEGLNPVTDERGAKLILNDKGVPIGKLPAGGHYFDSVIHPYEKIEEPEELDEVFSMSLMSDHDLDIMEQQAKDMYENTDKAILGEFIATFYEQGQYDFNYDTYFYNIAAEKELIHHYNKLLLNVYMEQLEKYLKRVGKYLTVIHFGDDLGTQQSLQISKEMYREMIKPYHRELYSYVHENYPEIKVFLHSCGAIYEMIPDLIDVGVDVLNPVQLSAKGMDPVKLKENFGDKLSFWGGGISTTQTGTFGTPEEVDAEVKRLMLIFGKGGGFVWNQVHNIQFDVPPANIVAMYDAAYKYGNIF